MVRSLRRVLIPPPRYAAARRSALEADPRRHADQCADSLRVLKDAVGPSYADCRLLAIAQYMWRRSVCATAAGIWAIGECAGSPQFTHVSEDDFRIIRDNLNGGNRSTSDRLIPYCMFTDPPLAHVGLSEGDAERQGVIVRVARLPLDSVLRAQAAGERQGFMKVLVGENDDRILGFTMIGAAAGEVMAVVQMAMLAGAPYGRLAEAILAHPTMAEGLGMLFSNVPRRSLHHVMPERVA
jgi:hypothetical protein